DDGARLRATLEHRADRAIREGSRDAGYLPREQALADALMSLLDGPGVGPRPTLHVHVDAAALARGRLAPGERCEVAGVGPVTVDMATSLAAAGRIVPDTPDGAESVRTRDRFIPSRLRAAVDARYPKCAITACPNSRALDYDHRLPLSQGGTTSLDNLWRLCRRRCHMLKTHHGWVPARKGDGWVLMPPARGP
ncbi:MAG: HNH endonuclease signature motif containing protein, partial [Actinomycetota bacterium]